MSPPSATTGPGPRLLAGPGAALSLSGAWRDRALALLTHAPTGSAAGAAERHRLAPGECRRQQDHGSAETLLWVSSGRLRLVWGPGTALEAGPGELVLIPARLQHDLQNPSPTTPAEYGLLQA